MAKGFSMNMLGLRAGTNHGYISQLEAGKILSPGTELLGRIADALDVPLSELTGKQTEEEQSSVEAAIARIARRYKGRVNEQELTRLLTLYLSLPYEEREKAQADMAWMKEMQERSQPANRVAEDEAEYKAEG